MILFFVAAVALASASASAEPTALPAGHPHVGGGATQQPAQQQQQFFRAPPDTADEDTSLPPGSIRVELRDPFNAVIANHAVDLGAINQSVAKGESRKHFSLDTDALGMATFADLEVAANIAYRVSVHEGAAAFGARPFQLPHDHGMHVVLHVYPPTSDFRGNTIATRGEVDIEVKDDRVQFVERYQVFNGAPVAWVPNDLVLALPAEFTALSSMQQMSDVGVDTVENRGARLHGTFPPGETTVGFSWQLPFSPGDGVIDLDVGLLPNMDQVLIGAAAAPGMKLSVTGFKEATAQTNEEGMHFLVTGKKLPQGEASPRKIHITLSDLPTPGPTRSIATAIAAVGIAFALYLATRQRITRSSKAAQKRDRTRILDEVEGLEQAHARGEVGPKTYERARRDLVDELASLLATSK